MVSSSGLRRDLGSVGVFAAPVPVVSVAQNQLSTSFCFSARHVVDEFLCVAGLGKSSAGGNVGTEAEPLFPPSLIRSRQV